MPSRSGTARTAAAIPGSPGADRRRKRTHPGDEGEIGMKVDGEKTEFKKQGPMVFFHSIDD
jgi:hypothetical protein